MKNQILKTKLLKIQSFIDNEWLDKYCELIESNRETKKEPYKTNSHHIIPQCYYTSNKLEIDNSKENLVNLLYKDHILAHYYLCLCTEGKLKYQMASAFFVLVNRRWKYEEFLLEIDLNIYQQLYENNKKLVSESRKGKPGKKHTLESNRRLAQSLIGKAGYRDEFNRKKASERMKGNTYRKNKKMAPESSLKISLAMTGKKFPEGTGAKIASKKKGFKYSEESKLKMKTQKAKIAKPVRCIETGEIFANAEEAEKWLGKGNVRDCVKYRQKSAGSYHWEFAREEDREEYLKKKEERDSKKKLKKQNNE